MRILDRNITATGAFITAATIAIGGFGAHGLKQLIDGSSLVTFEVGVRYQMYHGLAIVILGFAPWLSEKLKKAVFWFFIIGIVFFSGSIFLLSLNSILPFDATKIGFITPIGGLMFILGWLRLAYGLLKLRSQ
ncbi:DUF423 domain-containing protein [Aequorivita sp. H23M31]|uniref:DUF423 domain-containing protein n=1 Tax=Aequorivita ciconiae TaxID=2494375 RepID=A0A410G533_9FLAO|nr:DUF423 domain-containing protein [Aequorivita sp. H23M31]QAA82341.1 DUF423 domain-containing protein [Aequorivita sp. H23M31]